MDTTLSSIKASVTQIDSNQNLHIVSFDANGTKLKMVSLDLPENVKVGSKLLLSCKATSVAIAKDFSGALSYSNQLLVQIKSIEMGQLLCNLELTTKNFTLHSIITADSAKRMQLEVGEHVTALIKANDISIKEVLS